MLSAYKRFGCITEDTSLNALGALLNVLGALPNTPDALLNALEEEHYDNEVYVNKAPIHSVP